MRNAPLILSLSLLTVTLPALSHARARYNRGINIITSNYDLVDTTYIDRGRLDGVKVGDKFEVKFRDGKVATQVMVTGVYERMASVKIMDSWLLKDGQLAKFDQRPMIVALQSRSRRPAPDITVKAKKEAAAAPVSKPSAPATTEPAAPAVAAPAAAPAPEMPPAAPAGEPGAAAAPGAEISAPGMDGGLPAGPDAGGLPPSPDAGLPPPAAGAAPAPDAAPGGLPPDPGAGLPPDPGAAPGGLPPDPGAAAPAPDAGGGLPPDPGAAPGGLPPDPGAAPAGDPGIPPPPM
jgi:hypothetical protein